MSICNDVEPRESDPVEGEPFLAPKMASLQLSHGLSLPRSSSADDILTIESAPEARESIARSVPHSRTPSGSSVIEALGSKAPEQIHISLTKCVLCTITAFLVALWDRGGLALLSLPNFSFEWTNYCYINVFSSNPQEMVIMWVTRSATETTMVKYNQGDPDDYDSSVRPSILI